MNILAPLGAKEEVEMLAESGAEEFYCGITPMEWMEKYSPGVWINRRNPYAGFPSFKDLKEAVRQAENYEIPIFLTLNAPYYMEKQYPMLIDLIKRCTEEVGIKAFIVSDPGLMVAMKNKVPEAAIHVSSLAAPMNTGSIELYKQMQVERIVLPRSVQLNEIPALKEAAGDVELEVFILNDGCVYEESFCMTTHSAGAFCSQSQWDYEPFHSDGNKVLSEKDFKILNDQVNDYREFVWFVNDCNCQIANDGLPLGPCGLCSLGKLEKMGVDSLKVVGREGAPYRKLASVQMVKAVIDQVRAQASEREIEKTARKIRNQPQYCESGLMCYYR
ncbi:U32 family peptidase [Bacillus aerolatus]|uniref:U32 family peptidase n=1 Tax=Bacillus aerolatus TaxID=2653354 RepID=A0A6I1FU68_9BACI|nr:U32 family peptidase [Bacillus aerolatus]KAB7708245.1 U32 family peptidase [Bacillus aerolatus]